MTRAAFLAGAALLLLGGCDGAFEEADYEYVAGKAVTAAAASTGQLPAGGRLAVDVHTVTSLGDGYVIASGTVAAFSADGSARTFPAGFRIRVSSDVPEIAVPTPDDFARALAREAEARNEGWKATHIVAGTLRVDSLSVAKNGAWVGEARGEVALSKGSQRKAMWTKVRVALTDVAGVWKVTR